MRELLQNTPIIQPRESDMGKNPFSICLCDGIPRLMKEGTPVFPIAFWQWEFETPELENAHLANIEIFTCFGSTSNKEHPYWVGENEYDFSWYDRKIGEFFENRPESYLIPRIFVNAPDWWLEKHPEELTGFSVSSAEVRESFASELWKQESGEAFRQLLRHFRSMPWGSRIIGIHIAGGPCGEWHYWGAEAEPDCGPAMAARYGKPVPPLEKRDAQYWEAYYSAAVDAIGYFARILKEESDFLSVVFYGYHSLGGRTPCGAHNALGKLLALDCVDIVAAPHYYNRRQPGQDAYFRAYPATLARHGKLFFDEADDRTPFGKRPYGVGGRIMADTSHDAINFLRREFGNAITHCVGLWFMDIDRGMFRAPDYWTEIARAKYYGDRAMKLPWRRVSEIAVICENAGRFRLPPENVIDRGDVESFLGKQFPVFTHLGAPFDLYSTDDISVDALSKYRMIVLINCMALGAEARTALKSLQKEERSFVWFYGTGAFDTSAGIYSAESISDLTGLRFTLTDDQPMQRTSAFPNWNFYRDSRYAPGFSPLEAMADFNTWTSWYFGLPDASPEKLREIARRAGVFIYSETSDVLSVSESALMLHASFSGRKTIRLPKPKNVTDMISGNMIGKHITGFSFPLECGETALFELS